MLRWPALGLAGVLAVLALAGAGSAEAAAKPKFAKVAVPAEGDVTIAALRLKSRDTERPRLRLRSRRGLGDLQITASLRRRGRRSWDARVFVVNPSSGAARSAAVGAVFVGGPHITVATVALTMALLQPEVQKIREAAAKLHCQNDLKQLALAAHTGVYGVPNPKKLDLSVGRYFCQVGTTEQIAGAQAQLTRFGVGAPPCFGRAELFGGGLRELRFTIVCVEHTDGYFVTAQQGNAALDCLAPPGSSCACGPICRGAAEDACFRGAFPAMTPFTLNVRWDQDVPLVNGAVDVSATGFQYSVREFGVYLFRYTGSQAGPQRTR